MPQIFKALATINAWALFVIGWVSLIAGYIQLVGIYAGIGTLKIPAGGPYIWMPLVGGFVCLALSVAVMKLRKMLE